MATVTIQKETKYSARLEQLIDKLEQVEVIFGDIAKKRSEAINKLYHYAVTESKELEHDEAMHLIRKKTGLSRATIYNHLDPSVKRKYAKSLTPRQSPEQENYDKVTIECVNKMGVHTKFIFENVVVENGRQKFAIFYNEKNVHLKAK